MDTPTQAQVKARALELLNHRIFTVPIRAGQKVPYANQGEQWQDRVILNESHVYNPYNLPGDAGGLGISHLHSGTAVVDIDDLGKASAWWLEHYKIDLNHELKREDAVRIQSGKPNRAKLLYRVPPELMPLQSVKRDADGFELRSCTKKGTSLQDVICGIHPTTGQAYEVTGNLGRIPVVPDDLLRKWLDMLAVRADRRSLIGAPPNEAVIRSALSSIDPDIEYNDWLAIGMALDEVGLGDLWEEWSETGKSFKPGDCCARLQGFTPGGGATLGTLFHHAREAGWSGSDAWQSEADNLISNTSGNIANDLKLLAQLYSHCKPGESSVDSSLKQLAKAYGVSIGPLRNDFRNLLKNSDGKDLTHHGVAQHYLKSKGQAINSLASTYVYDQSAACWKPLKEEVMRNEIGERYQDQKLVQTATGVSGVIKQALSFYWHDDYFANAPHKGIATLSGFHVLQIDGTFQCQPHAPEHRVRRVLPADPIPWVPGSPDAPPLFCKLLEALGNTDPNQELVLAEYVAACLLREVAPLKRALFLLGAHDSGKSQMLRIMELLIGEENRTAIEPHQFSEPYFAAVLADSMLNCVGEVPIKEDVASAAFLKITSGDSITGRHPSGRPFSYRPSAGQVYANNHLPKTSMTGEYFWRRWALVEFSKSVPADEQIPNLGEKVFEKELGQLVYWVMQGAQRVHKNKCYSLGTKHEELIADWRLSHNVFLKCLNAEDGPFLKGESMKLKFDQLHAAVKDWALSNGYRQSDLPGRSELVKQASEHFTMVKHGRSIGNHLQGIGIAIDTHYGN
ncbi:MAG: PriCT-2 domain-containing protein [Pseudomonadaceae bacterium]|nr:PriCT-2 domain-containing protein [Pseudomonadaceae bacterium]